jgi:hypothetical protein
MLRYCKKVTRELDSNQRIAVLQTVAFDHSAIARLIFIGAANYSLSLVQSALEPLLDDDQARALLPSLSIYKLDQRSLHPDHLTRISKANNALEPPLNDDQSRALLLTMSIAKPDQRSLHPDHLTRISKANSALEPLLGDDQSPNNWARRAIKYSASGWA